MTMAETMTTTPIRVSREADLPDIPDVGCEFASKCKRCHLLVCAEESPEARIIAVRLQLRHVAQEARYETSQPRNVAEAAALLGMAPRTWHRQRSRGLVPEMALPLRDGDDSPDIAERSATTRRVAGHDFVRALPITREHVGKHARTPVRCRLCNHDAVFARDGDTQMGYYQRGPLAPCMAKEENHMVQTRLW